MRHASLLLRLRTARAPVTLSWQPPRPPIWLSRSHTTEALNTDGSDGATSADGSSFANPFRSWPRSDITESIPNSSNSPRPSFHCPCGAKFDSEAALLQHKHDEIRAVVVKVCQKYQIEPGIVLDRILDGLKTDRESLLHDAEAKAAVTTDPEMELLKAVADSFALGREATGPVLPKKLKTNKAAKRKRWARSRAKSTTIGAFSCACG
jgi:hypothetical protein